MAGTVTLRGSPVTTGHVNFFDPSRGTGARGALDSSGGFALNGTLPPGEYLVYVSPPPAPPPNADAKAPARPVKGARFDVPKKYTAPETSGVTIKVTPGPNVIPIDLPG